MRATPAERIEAMIALLDSAYELWGAADFISGDILSFGGLLRVEPD